MRPVSRSSSIKTAQKEREIFRVISVLLREAGRDNPELANIFLNRVQLTPGKGMCNLYVYTPLGVQEFERIRPHLVLYKPSIRKALAHELNARYTADLTFIFDEQFDRTMRMESILNKISHEEGVASSTPSSSDVSSED